jgi:hypothetical protein
MQWNKHMIQINPTHTRILACATVIEEILPIMPSQMRYSILDFGLHVNPDSLKHTLQKTIKENIPGIDTIILGYGLCSQAVVGLKSDSCTLLIPRVDDCIALFLGSTETYKLQQKQNPGTYYLTKGWMKSGDTPFDEFDALINKYGAEKAKLIMNKILKNYTRLAFINTGSSDLEQLHAQAREIAYRFDLHYEEIPGSDTLINKMLYGPWDDDFIIAQPGQMISFMDFRRV